MILQDLVDLLRGEVLEVGAVDHTGLGIPGKSESGQDVWGLVQRLMADSQAGQTHNTRGRGLGSGTEAQVG